MNTYFLKKIQQIFLFIIVGMIALVVMLAIQNISTRAFDSRPLSIKENEDSTKDVRTINVKETDYIENLFISYCDKEYLQEHAFKEDLKVGDQLSNYIFPEGSMIEYKCI